MREEVTALDIQQALLEGFELIEDYPDDPRGHSCVLLTQVKGKPMHIVCAIHEDTLIIVTVYTPSLQAWEEGFRKRRETP